MSKAGAEENDRGQPGAVGQSFGGGRSWARQHRRGARPHRTQIRKAAPPCLTCRLSFFSSGGGAEAGSGAEDAGGTTGSCCGGSAGALIVDARPCWSPRNQTQTVASEFG